VGDAATIHRVRRVYPVQSALFPQCGNEETIVLHTGKTTGNQQAKVYCVCAPPSPATTVADPVSCGTHTRLKQTVHLSLVLLGTPSIMGAMSSSTGGGGTDTTVCNAPVRNYVDVDRKGGEAFVRSCAGMNAYFMLSLGITVMVVLLLAYAVSINASHDREPLLPWPLAIAPGVVGLVAFFTMEPMAANNYLTAREDFLSSGLTKRDWLFEQNGRHAPMSGFAELLPLAFA